MRASGVVSRDYSKWGRTYRNGEASGHPIKIVGVLAHSHHLGHNGLICPLHTEDFCKLLEVLGRCLTDGEDGVAQPAHTQAAQLLVEELDTELRGKERDVFDDGQSHAPLLVFCELNDGGKKGLRQELNADNWEMSGNVHSSADISYHCSPAQASILCSAVRRGTHP